MKDKTILTILFVLLLFHPTTLKGSLVMLLAVLCIFALSIFWRK